MTSYYCFRCRPKGLFTTRLIKYDEVDEAHLNNSLYLNIRALGPEFFIQQGLCSKQGEKVNESFFYLCDCNYCKRLSVKKSFTMIFDKALAKPATSEDAAKPDFKPEDNTLILDSDGWVSTEAPIPVAFFGKVRKLVCHLNKRDIPHPQWIVKMKRFRQKSAPVAPAPPVPAANADPVAPARPPPAADAGYVPDTVTVDGKASHGSPLTRTRDPSMLFPKVRWVVKGPKPYVVAAMLTKEEAGNLEKSEMSALCMERLKSFALSPGISTDSQGNMETLIEGAIAMLRTTFAGCWRGSEDDKGPVRAVYFSRVSKGHRNDAAQLFNLIETAYLSYVKTNEMMKADNGKGAYVPFLEHEDKYPDGANQDCLAQCAKVDIDGENHNNLACYMQSLKLQSQYNVEEAYLAPADELLRMMAIAEGETEFSPLEMLHSEAPSKSNALH